MNGSEIGQSPLFQLNLMLWLAWYPLIEYEISGIRPIFREDGYEIQAIGPPITLTPQIEIRARSAGLDVNRTATPDLVIRHNQRKILIPIECKLKSFGPGSDGVQQAYVLLSATGSRVADAFGLLSPSAWTSFVLYGLEADNHKLMIGTLEALQNNLSAAQIDCVSAGSVGIAIKNGRVYLQALPDGMVPIAILRSSDGNDGWIEVMNLDHIGDPTPLSLIPIDPSIQAHDPEGRLILERKLRSSITSCIGRKLDEEEFEITEDEIMRSAIDVWDLWRDNKAKEGLMKLVRQHLREILAEMRSSRARIDYQQRVIRFREVTVEVADSIRRYMTSAGYRRGEIDWDISSPQMRFEDIDDQWT